jgi:hypothetical protein
MHPRWYLAALLLIGQGLVPAARAATATGATGLEGTGYTTSGSAITAGTTSGSAAWVVTGDIANGVSASKFLGTTYVVSSLLYGWVANQSDGDWITAPGATEYAGAYPASDSSNLNVGGYYLPGVGTSYAATGTGGLYYQEGVYVYTLTFTITGSGSNGQAVTNFGLNLSAAADSNYTVYINPTESGGLPTSTAAYTSASTDGTSAQTLSIGYNATSANYTLGTDTLVFVVDNNDGVSGASGNNQTTPSGLLVYDVSSVVPEVSPWLPLAGALAAYAAAGFVRWRQARRAPGPPAEGIPSAPPA